MDNSLRSLLNNLPRESLLRIARAQAIPVSSERKAELVALLRRQMSEPRCVRALLAQLPASSQVVFRHVQAAGGRVFSRTLISELERDGLVQAELYANGRRSNAHQVADGLPTFGEAVAPLLDRALLLSATNRYLPPTSENLARYNTELLMAREVLDATREAAQPLAHITSVLLSIHEASAQDFQRDVYLYWNYVREQSVTLTAAGLVPKRHLVKLNDALIHKEDTHAARDETQVPRLHFVRLQMEATGLIRRVKRQLEAVPSAHEFFGYSLARRSDRFFEAWKRSSEWNELLHLPIRPRQHEQRSPKAAQLVARARQYVLSLIEEYASQEWLSIADLVKKVRASHYEFLFKRTREDYGAVNPYYYFHNPLGWGFPVGDEGEGWQKVESEFIRSIVCQPLHWLGLVSLGDEDDQLTAFQLTPLGAYVFGLSAHAPSDDPAAVNGQVVVQPNFQIFALEPIAEQTLASLDRVADRVKADKVYEYHLTRESVYRAQQNGMCVPDVIAFLARAASTPLPQNVQRTLEEWGESFERIVIRRHVSLLHALDSEVLDHLQAESATQPFVLSRPLPRVLVTRGEPSARDALMQALNARQQLPAFENDEAHSALTLDDDGKVTLLHPVPNIFLIQALEEHAERRNEGYYLSERIVKAERTSGESTEQIIARWQQWHHGALPQTLLTQVKRWGRFYGAAHNAPLRLVQLPSADVVTALLVDPEIGPYVQAYAPDPTVVLVCADDVERVRVILDARGIVVQ